MGYQEASSYEVETMEEVQRQCDSIASELCHEAQDAGLECPYVIRFLDESGTFLELTVNEGEEDWQWVEPIENGPWQCEGERLTAVLRSGARRPIHRFFQLRWPSLDGE